MIWKHTATALCAGALLSDCAASQQARDVQTSGFPGEDDEVAGLTSSSFFPARRDEASGFLLPTFLLTRTYQSGVGRPTWLSSPSARQR